jgi:acetyl esterase/lipase
MIRLFTLTLSLLLLAAAVTAQDKKDTKDKKDAKEVKKPPIQPKPTAANFAYGKHERQVLDFWQAKSDKPTPLVLYIHGGGWRNGDKNTLSGTVIKAFTDAGISVAAINYRLISKDLDPAVQPPVKAPLEDAARALQTLRSKAKEWNIDKKLIGATGGSAGACSSLWLAFHDDLANPKSEDPIARESTRLHCAAVNGAQTSLDPNDVTAWIPNYSYGAHAFGLANIKELKEKREKVLPWIQEYSPFNHVSKDDPAIGLFYAKQDTPPVVGTTQKDATHSGVMGIKLEEKLKSVGVDCVLVHQDKAHPKYKSTTDYLIDHLKK